MKPNPTITNMKPVSRASLVGLATWLLAVTSSSAQVGDRVSFNRDIRPILSENCFACHGPDANHRKAGLRLDTFDGATKRHKGKAAVVPGKPDTSQLLARITANDPEERMPPKASEKTLSPRQVNLLRRWIAQGAEYERHWSFIPPQRPELPRVGRGDWGLNPIDAFILARLESESLKPSAEADKRTLIRRLYLDLTGLPPSVEQVHAFVNDNKPDAYERVVDALLASPHYGERMAMHWLDLVRFADTVGYHGDQDHNISPYRDYVIKAFNENKPFDQFTVEQLAGDLMPKRDGVDDLWRQVATGYNRLLQTSHEGGVQQREYLAKYLADRVRNVSSVWLGVTMGCAECHNHKYDPLTQADFYSLGAFFADVDELGTFRGSNSLPTRRPPEMPAPNIAQATELKQIDAELAALNDPAAAALSEADAAKVKSMQARRDAIVKQFRLTMVTRSVAPREIRVLPRGDWLSDAGSVVQPAVPETLGALDVSSGRATRLDLAKWIASRDNPLTARVFVNRLWRLFYGNGLSNVLDDVGAQGEWPTHPELLDWLAVEFMNSGWDVNHMVKLMVMSRTYRQSSLVSDDLLKRDPFNRLYARQSRWRLQAELVRDTALTNSGLLVRTVGGHSVKPYQPAGYYQHLNFPTRTYKHDASDSQWRRGVYMHWQRVFLHPMLLAFDAPTREECAADRPTSNTPRAALALLNDPTFVEAARVFAQRVMREGGRSVDERIAFAFETATSRRPTNVEIGILRNLYTKHHTQFSKEPAAAEALLKVGLKPLPDDLARPELAAWTSVARAILNLNESITRN